MNKALQKSLALIRPTSILWCQMAQLPMIDGRGWEIRGQGLDIAGRNHIRYFAMLEDEIGDHS
ncbi:MAG: hypothetical protein CMP83_07245 [Gammaproteobacteria bacterium]|nr:hypothetical protein [Gammaproteobacteria bacterium]MAQ61801.1 hypothetical protein [Gammaproteobacteria bacterium]HBX00309.1 hypothetical protein [Gammaproteobacteria bacterium]